MTASKRVLYVPVLKGKRGEFQALQNLTSPTKTQIMPLIEVAPIPWDYEEDKATREIDDHLSAFVANLVKSWNTASPVFVDTCFIPLSERMKDGSHPLAYVLEQASNKGVKTVPVMGLDGDKAYHEAVKDAVARDNLGMCIRIKTDDIEDEDLESHVDKLIHSMGVDKKLTDIVIDLKSIQKGQMGLLVRSVRDVIRSLPDLPQWRNLIVLATAFPQTMSGFEPNAVSLTDRTEWQLWTTLAHSKSKIERIPTFGDYATVHPELLDIDPRVMQLGAKIKYTYDSDWIIVKGRSIRMGGSEQTRQLCKTLVQLPQYTGPDFSWGDRYIHDCADGKEGVGNQTTWVSVGVNHHITFVVRQVANFLASGVSP